jgi:hypothetical protein
MVALTVSEHKVHTGLGGPLARHVHHTEERVGVQSAQLGQLVLDEVAVAHTTQ